MGESGKKIKIKLQCLKKHQTRNEKLTKVANADANYNHHSTFTIHKLNY